MWEDPIVTEVRKIREDYAARFNFDLQALCRALKESELRDPRPKVALPPKRIKPSHTQNLTVVIAEDTAPYKSQDE